MARAILFIFCLFSSTASALKKQIDPELIRNEEFSFAPGYLTFNHGSYGATPKDVDNAQRAFTVQAQGRPDPWFRTDYFPLLSDARNRIAQYVGTSATNIVLLENASSAINAIFRSLVFSPGDKVIYFNTAYIMVKNVVQYMTF